MNQRKQNRYVGITFAFVGLTLALAGGSVSDDAVTGTIIYVCGAVVVLLGLFVVVRDDRRWRPIHAVFSRTGIPGGTGAPKDPDHSFRPWEAETTNHR